MSEEYKQLSNENLKNTALIDNTEYNINAVKANYVANELTISPVGMGGGVKKTEVVKFDGGEAKRIEVVAATGGKFKGHVRVPDAGTKITINNKEVTNMSGNDFVDEAVLNYSDIKNKVLSQLLNNSPMASWTGSELSFSTDTSLNGICVITGKYSHMESFITKNKDSAESGELNWIRNCLYLCTDGESSPGCQAGNIYLITFSCSDIGDSKSANHMCVRLATTATYLDTPTNVYVNLESDSSAAVGGTSTTSAPGVYGVLPVEHGGTDAETFVEAEYNINNTIQGVASGVTDNDNIVFKRVSSASPTTGALCTRGIATLWAYIAEKIRSTFGFSSGNVLSTTKGGTGVAANTIDDICVGKAKNDSNGTPINTGYYKCTACSINNNNAWDNTITVSTSDPSTSSSPAATNAKPGDIWIKY